MVKVLASIHQLIIVTLITTQDKPYAQIVHDTLQLAILNKVDLLVLQRSTPAKHVVMSDWPSLVTAPFSLTFSSQAANFYMSKLEHSAHMVSLLAHDTADIAMIRC